MNSREGDISELIGLKLKMYSLNDLDGQERKKAKGRALLGA